MVINLRNVYVRCYYLYFMPIVLRLNIRNMWVNPPEYRL